MDKSPVLKNSWICESEKVILTSPVMDLVEQNCRSSEDEKKHRFFLLRSRDWSNIIPVTEDGKIVMVKQYRIGIGGHTLEVPGGVTDLTDFDTQEAAIRELEEETGYRPLEGARCVSLGWTYPNPAIMNNRCHSYVIGPVRRVVDQKLDPGEMIEVVEVPISEIPARILSGEINHALMLNAFFFLALQAPSLSGGLADVLGGFTQAKARD